MNLLLQAIKAAVQLDHFDPNILSIGINAGVCPRAEAVVKVLEATHVEPETFELLRKAPMKFHSVEMRKICQDMLARHPMTLDEALQAPEVDRQRFRDTCDRAATGTEHINLRSLRAKYSRQMAEAKGLAEIFTALRATAPETLSQHPCLRYVAANLPWFRPAGEEGQRHLAENLSREFFEAARFARNVAAMRPSSVRESLMTVWGTEPTL